MANLTAPVQPSPHPTYPVSPSLNHAFLSPVNVGKLPLLAAFGLRRGLPVCRQHRIARHAPPSLPQKTSPRSSLLLPAGLPAGVLTALQSHGASFFSLVQKGVPLNGVLYVLARVLGQNMLTSAGLVHALYLGSLLWSCGGFGVYMLCLSFLIVGSTLTRLGRAKKEAAGIAEKRGGARGPENLWGAAGAAALCALLAAILRSVQTTPFALPHGVSLATLKVAELCMWCAYNGSIASKFADTASSEVGKAYGSKTYLVTNWLEVPRGTEGAVSFEGTLAGIVASVVAALLGRLFGVLHTSSQVVVVVVAATIANYFESWIGASIQDRYHFSNEQVNFFNTCAGAILAGLGCYLLVVMGGAVV